MKLVNVVRKSRLVEKLVSGWKTPLMNCTGADGAPRAASFWAARTPDKTARLPVYPELLPVRVRVPLPFLKICPDPVIGPLSVSLLFRRVTLMLPPALPVAIGRLTVTAPEVAAVQRFGGRKLSPPPLPDWRVIGWPAAPRLASELNCTAP